MNAVFAQEDEQSITIAKPDWLQKPTFIPLKGRGGKIAAIYIINRRTLSDRNRNLNGSAAFSRSLSLAVSAWLAELAGKLPLP